MQKESGCNRNSGLRRPASRIGSPPRITYTRSRAERWGVETFQNRYMGVTFIKQEDGSGAAGCSQRIPLF